MKLFAPLCALSLLPVLSVAAWGAEPDDLILPPGFHASVVAENLGEYTRHMAFRDASHMYVSTEPQTKDAANQGVIALHLDAKHHADTQAHFSTIHNGTAIAVYKGALYTSSPTTLYRIKLSGKELVPSAKPEIMIDGIPGRAAIAFDGTGNLFVAIGGGGNVCAPNGTPRTSKSVGPMPCPLLETRSGVWRFDAAKTGQTWAEGEHTATGIRDTNALAWSKNAGALYAVNYGRDAAEKAYPEFISIADGAHISDEMFKVVKGTDMGWPYTYYDSAKNIRLAQPEYGGDGKTVVTDAKYAVPVAAFPAHVAPMDIAIYDAAQFPAAYRGGAFVAFHGAGGGDPAGHDDGYNVMFVPIDKAGKAGAPQVFADGFAGPTREDKNGKRARYRPVGVTVGPDGALYVAESQKGRIWRIAYTGK
ncbi:MAG: PQQ-dependent sugar dehydrogenase [Pseudomonadota bacterium]